MDYANKSWIRLGNVDFPVHYLITVTEEEAVALLGTNRLIHEDRIRNAWKQANNFKDPNRKKQESVKVAIIEPKDSEKVIQPKKRGKR